MHPVLVSLGDFVISSFGFFLAAGFILGIFVIWRLCISYDIDEEKTLDTSLVTFFGGLIGARIVFVATHLSVFTDLLRVLSIQRYPGFDFWGGIISGVLTLKLLSSKIKVQFWQLADFVVVGVFMALFLGSVGCFLGSCQYGVVSNSFLSFPQAGLLGNRFPVQLLSALIYLLGFLYLWKICLRFHFMGKVTAAGFILLGLTKLLTDPLRGERTLLLPALSINQILGLICLIFGIYTIYTQGRRSLTGDLRFFLDIFINSKVRRSTLSKIYRSCYNLVTNFKINIWRFKKRFHSRKKVLQKVLNVKPNPPQF